MKASPATSSANRVQRAHWMHRSRSKSTRGPISIGLAQVPLLLVEAALPRAMRDRLVLERALAALVAYRAVERVVQEQVLDDALLGLLGCI